MNQKFSFPIDLNGDVYNSWSSAELGCDCMCICVCMSIIISSII